MSEEVAFFLKICGEVNYVELDKMLNEILKLGYSIRLDGIGNIKIFRYTKGKK